MSTSFLEGGAEKLREEELEEARAIQSMMLPTESLRAGAVRISHAFQPVAAVGGDFLDYFQMSDGNIGLYVGDVSGKELAAAMYAALAVGAVARGAQNGPVAQFHALHFESQIAGSQYTSSL